ncbi:MAG: polyisoprenyl-phosphate glycosyltransferase, partial [Thermoleophilaceae bacterium]|nr:polyisoprenyl-phosphate glycosyltransferase [Thermoleophilaceae bacterium]
MDERRLELLSVVVPVRDEEGTVGELFRRIDAALGGVPFELVLVDDASTDRTPELLDSLADSDPRVRVLHLARNFGHQAALTAGLEHARGNAVAMLDGDLQDPPELLPAMLAHWTTGSDVVSAVRTDRAGESRMKLATAHWFYRFFAKLSDLDLTQDAGDFRLLDRRALDALLSLRERNRFLRGMSAWIGYTQTSVPYQREPRHAGQTKFTLRKMLRFSLDAITSFSWRPLQLATVLGFLLSGVALLTIPLVIGLRLAGETIPGFATVLCVVLLLGGIQLLTIGIIGEYVGRIYDEVKGRPLYLLRSTRGGLQPAAVAEVAEGPHQHDHHHAHDDPE